MQNRYLPFLVLVFLCLIWSSTWLAIKLGLEFMPPFFSAGWRFFLAFLLMLLVSLIRKERFPKDVKTHLFLFFFGFNIFTAGYGLVYWGEQYINSGLTSVLFSVMPFYTAFLAIKILPEENVTLRKLLGMVVGFSGVALIFSDQLAVTHPMAIWGMLAVLLSPFFSALGTLMGKKVSTKMSPFILNTLPMFYASLSFLTISFLFEDTSDMQLNKTAIFSMIYLGVFGTAIAFFLYFWLLKQLSAIIVSMITFITPPLALIWGWIVLGEIITWKVVAGMIIIFTGIYFVRERKVKYKAAV